MHNMHDLKGLLCTELEDYAEKAKSGGKMSGAELEAVHTITDTIKNILKIDALEEESGYSGENYYMGEGRIYGTSYGQNRDRMGRYSRDDGYSTRRHYVRGHYSRDDGKSYMMEKLEEMMDKAEKPAEREALERCMKALERA